jgi:hypothetical protein
LGWKKEVKEKDTVLSIPDSLGQLARQFSRLLSEDGAGILPGLLLPATSGGRQESGGAVQRAVGQAAGSLLGGPLGLIAGALASLFSREREAPALPLFERPQALALDFDISQLEPRLASGRTDVGAGQSNGSGGDAPTVSGGAARDTAAPIVTIQVNAMDARSFAEHRDEIASAVKEALTRNHGLRDEIWED